MRKRIIEASLIACIIFLIYDSFTENGNSIPNRPPAPSIAVKSLNGNIALSEFKGKVVMIDFFATWCLPCRISLPGIISLYHQYHKSGLEVMGVSLDSSSSAVTNYLQSNRVPYPAGISIYSNSIADYKVQTIPMVILIDKKGRLRWRQEGFSPIEERTLASQIVALLKEPDLGK